MVHFMGKAEYFEGKGIKGRFKKWWFTSVGVFPVDRSGGSKSLGALAHAREILEEGHLFGIHVEGTRSPDGRLYRGHTGAARLALETGCPLVPTALVGTREIQHPGQVIPSKGKTKVIYGKPIPVDRKDADGRSPTISSARSESSADRNTWTSTPRRSRRSSRPGRRPKPQPPAKAADRRSRTRTKRLPLSN